MAGMKYNPATGQFEEADDQEILAMASRAPSVAPTQITPDATVIGPAPLPQRQSEPVAAPQPQSSQPFSLPDPRRGPDTVGKVDKHVATTTRRTEISKGERAAEADVGAKLQENADLERKSGEVAASSAEAEAQRAAEDAERKAAAEAQKAQIVADGEKEYTARKQQADQAFEHWRKADIKDYYADKGQGAKLMDGLGVVLGAYAQGLSGGRVANTALTIVTDKMDRDFTKQKMNIEKQLQVAEKWGSRADEAREDMQSQLKMLDLKQAAAEATVAAKVREAAARTKSEEARINAEQAAVTLEQKAAERRAKFLEAERKEIQTVVEKRTVQGDPAALLGGAGIKLTEGQGKAADFLGRIVGDAQALDNLPPMSEKGRKKLRDLANAEAAWEKYPASKAAAAAVGLYKTPEEVLDDQDRQVFAAGKRVATAVLRGDSGASIGLSEYVGWDQQYLPQPGDKAQDIESKSKARRALLNGMAIKAGPGAALALQGQQQQSAPQRQAPDAGMVQRAKAAAAEGGPRGERAKAWLQQQGIQ